MINSKIIISRGAINNRQQAITNLEIERDGYKQSDKQFKDALINAFNLASKAHYIFTVSKNTEKRQLINIMFSKLE